MEKLENVMIGSWLRLGNETIQADVRIATIINSGAKHRYKPVIVCEQIADWICSDNDFVINDNNIMSYEFEGQLIETPCIYTDHLHEWQLIYRLLIGKELIVRATAIDELFEAECIQADEQAYQSHINDLVDSKKYRND